LLHRGYPIDQLATKADYLETCYLLLNGELPTAEQKKEFDAKVRNHTMVHDQVSRFYNGFRRDAHPMAIMVGVVGALSAFYHNNLDIENVDLREITALRLIANVHSWAAWSYEYTISQPFVYARNDLNYAENVLHRMVASPVHGDYKMDPILAKVMVRGLTLHTDHEQDAS